jgi:hypothetical protein
MPETSDARAGAQCPSCAPVPRRGQPQRSKQRRASRRSTAATQPGRRPSLSSPVGLGRLVVAPAPACAGPVADGLADVLGLRSRLCLRSAFLTRAASPGRRWLSGWAPARHGRTARHLAGAGPSSMREPIDPAANAVKRLSAEVAVCVSVHQPSSDRTLAVWLDSAPDLSCNDSTQTYVLDLEHQATDLAVGGSNPSRRANIAAHQPCNQVLPRLRSLDCDHDVAVPAAVPTWARISTVPRRSI